MSVEVHSTMLVDMHVLISRQFPLLSQINHEESAERIRKWSLYQVRLQLKCTIHVIQRSERQADLSSVYREVHLINASSFDDVAF